MKHMQTRADVINEARRTAGTSEPPRPVAEVAAEIKELQALRKEQDRLTSLASHRGHPAADEYFAVSQAARTRKHASWEEKRAAENAVRQKFEEASALLCEPARAEVKALDRRLRALKAELKLAQADAESPEVKELRRKLADLDAEYEEADRRLNPHTRDSRGRELGPDPLDRLFLDFYDRHKAYPADYKDGSRPMTPDVEQEIAEIDRLYQQRQADTARWQAERDRYYSQRQAYQEELEAMTATRKRADRALSGVKAAGAATVEAVRRLMEDSIKDRLAEVERNVSAGYMDQAQEFLAWLVDNPGGSLADYSRKTRRDIHMVARLVKQAGGGWEAARDAQAQADRAARMYVESVRQFFVSKNTAKIADIVAARELAAARLLYSRVAGTGRTLETAMRFSFTDGSEFEVRNSVVIVWDAAKPFARYPTTFHNVVRADGTRMASPSEEKMKSGF